MLIMVGCWFVCVRLSLMVCNLIWFISFRKEVDMNVNVFFNVGMVYVNGIDIYYCIDGIDGLWVVFVYVLGVDY